MKVSFASFLAFISITFASELPSDVNPTTRSTYNFAIDTANQGTLAAFKCIYNLGYKTSFIQVYNPTNSGSVSQYGNQNVVASSEAGLGTEIYVTPSPSGKPAYQQFDEAYNSVRSYGINVVKIWLQRLSLERSYGVAVGIYTNWYQWLLITGNTIQFANTVDLWYWDAYGTGGSAEGIADFSDFRNFGGWSKASIKQFALNEALCGIWINRSIYAPSALKKEPILLKDSVNSTFKYNVGGFV
uniref:Lysozyme n=1 Tax=Panagrellus redivivus TaxID=6233 RepID=A0A7E4ZXM0_PANRE